jgi:hypothetical protein
MNTRTEPTAADFAMDATALYHEEVFTDRRIGTLRRLTPIDATGQVDASRKVLYLGETQVMTPAGALPIAFEIDASNPGDAASQFGQLAKEAVERTVRELQEMRRHAASSIVLPGSAAAAGLGGPPASKLVRP